MSHVADSPAQTFLPLLGTILVFRNVYLNPRPCNVLYLHTCTSKSYLNLRVTIIFKEKY
jgi:hypothetical protein